VNALTVRELELRRAQLAERAERLRQEWRNIPSASARALQLGKEVKALQERADDYGRVMEIVTRMNGGAEVVFVEAT
jgi:hypothetical protein